MGLHTVDGKRTSARDVMGPRPSGAPLGPSIEGNPNSVVPYIVGFQEDGFGELGYGVKVAKQGFDARTAEGDELVMSSEFNLFKIVGTGSVTVNVPSSTGSLTIEHGLDGFIPAFIGYVITPPQYGAGNPVTNQMPYTEQSPLGTTKALVQGSVDADNFYINIQTDGSANVIGNWLIRYYLLRNTATG